MAAVGRSDDRSQWHALVHDLGHVRHVFTDLDTIDVGLDGIEFTTDLGRGIRFQIVHVLVRWGTYQVNHDDGLVGILDPGLCLSMQQLGQREASHSQGSDFHEFTTGDAVAQLVISVADGKHDFVLIREGINGRLLYRRSC